MFTLNSSVTGIFELPTITSLQIPYYTAFNVSNPASSTLSSTTLTNWLPVAYWCNCSSGSSPGPWVPLWNSSTTALYTAQINSPSTATLTFTSANTTSASTVMDNNSYSYNLYGSGGTVRIFFLLLAGAGVKAYSGTSYSGTVILDVANIIIDYLNVPTAQPQLFCCTETTLKSFKLYYFGQQL
jgi:hypothetical protein